MIYFSIRVEEKFAKFRTRIRNSFGNQSLQHFGSHRQCSERQKLAIKSLITSRKSVSIVG